jgi:hypothetical protein
MKYKLHPHILARDQIGNPQRAKGKTEPNIFGELVLILEHGSDSGIRSTNSGAESQSPQYVGCEMRSGRIYSNALGLASSVRLENFAANEFCSSVEAIPKPAYILTQRRTSLDKRCWFERGFEPRHAHIVHVCSLLSSASPARAWRTGISLAAESRRIFTKELGVARGWTS